MTTAFHDWLAGLPPQTIEVIPGLLAGAIPYGGLSDPDIEPGQPVTAGGYGEDRGDYKAALFSSPCGDERRTIHLGIDVFAPAGAVVRAPLAGQVHSFRDNKGMENYGPAIVLEHTPTPALTFHTLYGHLSRPSIAHLSPGQTFAAGDVLGHLGARDVNGGWSPHLHFQILLNIGGYRGDYPGLATRTERDRWLAICPDPSRLLGLPEGGPE